MSFADKKNLEFGYRIGILGGGQLARMLVIEGQKLGFQMHVLSALPTDPAAHVTRHWTQGDLSDSHALSNFYKTVQVVTIESEFLDHHVLLAAEASSRITTEPSPHWISEFSDRLKQKSWLERMKIPSTPFNALSRAQDAEVFFSKFKKGVVFKKRRFGYDGYGTYIVRSKEGLKKWLTEHHDSLGDFIVEPYIAFQKELAFQLAVNASGKSLTYPLVEWKAKDAKCFWVKGPVKHPKFNFIKSKITSALHKSGYHGLMAFEFFSTGKNLLVNELAPRVHNSGHYTLEAFPVNQFKAHLLAITNFSWPKENAIAAKGFAMVNLIGNGTSSPKYHVDGKSYLHWYGKIENRKGRKMGHITAMGNSAALALKSALKSSESWN